MQEHIYKVVELVGSSETSIEDAINVAISRARQNTKPAGFEPLKHRQPPRRRTDA